MRVSHQIRGQLLVVAAALTIAGRVSGAEAAILPWARGTHGEIQLLASLRDGLEEVTLMNGKVTVRPTGQEEVLGLSVAKDGWVYAVRKDLLLRTNEEMWNKREWQEVVRPPSGGAIFTDVACDPVSGLVAMSAYNPGEKDPETGEVPYVDPLQILLPGSPDLQPVFCRRVDYLNGIVFSSGGELYFGQRGDLWRGVIVPDDPNSGRPVLVGQRIAPLATYETNSGNQSQQGVHLVAVGAGYVWTHVGRLGGSGYGSIVRLPMPEPLGKSERGNYFLQFDPEERYPIYAKMMSEAVIAESIGQPRSSLLCASSDGKTVIYRDTSRWEKSVVRVVTTDEKQEFRFGEGQ